MPVILEVVSHENIKLRHSVGFGFDVCLQKKSANTLLACKQLANSLQTVCKQFANVCKQNYKQTTTGLLMLPPTGRGIDSYHREGSYRTVIGTYRTVGTRYCSYARGVPPLSPPTRSHIFGATASLFAY